MPKKKKKPKRKQSKQPPPEKEPLATTTTTVKKGINALSDELQRRIVMIRIEEGTACESDVLSGACKAFRDIVRERKDVYHLFDSVVAALLNDPIGILMWQAYAEACWTASYRGSDSIVILLHFTNPDDVLMEWFFEEEDTEKIVRFDLGMVEGRFRFKSVQRGLGGSSEFLTKKEALALLDHFQEICGHLAEYPSRVRVAVHEAEDGRVRQAGLDFSGCCEALDRVNNCQHLMVDEIDLFVMEVFYYFTYRWGIT